MRKQIRRPLGIVVVSVLLVALAAGAALAAVVQCVPGAATCPGTTQADKITGTDGVDSINASFGNDEVYAEGGDDSVVGGDGNDILIGDGDIPSRGGNDRISGGSGDDALDGLDRSDYLDGGSGNDTIYAQDQYYKYKDTILGGTGADTIYAHDEVVDSIDCGDNIDKVTYDSGIDVVAANCENRLPQSSVVADFSATQNPSGVWSYGYQNSSGGSFTLYPSHANPWGPSFDQWSLMSSPTITPHVTFNNTGKTASYSTITHPPDVLNLHPGPSGEKSVVRWRAPFSGTVTIAGNFEGIDTHGTTTDVAVVHNSSATLFSDNINGYKTSGSLRWFWFSKSVVAGETIDFSVGYGSNRTYSNDSTGLSATITRTS